MITDPAPLQGNRITLRCAGKWQWEKYIDHYRGGGEEVYRFWIEEEDGVTIPQLDRHVEFGVLVLTQQPDGAIDCYIDEQEPFQPASPLIEAPAWACSNTLHHALEECLHTTGAP